MSRDGHAIAAWRQGDPNSDLLSSSRPPDTTHWGTPSPVATDWPGAEADVALDEAGNATAVWMSSGTVSASFKPEGKPWQDDYLLSSYDDSAAAPAVATYGSQVATAVWIRAGEENDRIQFVNYDVDTSAKEAAADDEGDDEGDSGDDSGDEYMGTSRADRLVGTPGNDVFYGLGGNDTIIGRGGRDIVFAGPGNDRILGGAGADRLYGGAGADVIAGGHGRDLLVGGAGRDRISGGRGADILVGGAGRDRLQAGAGNDVLRARDGLRDRVNGGRGLDQYRLDRWLDRARSIESRLG
jgi:Ca2+-binding RTX toxin-like protein